MKAEQAREFALSMQQRIEGGCEYAEILSRINIAVAKGNFTCIVPLDTPDTIKQILKRNGYTFTGATTDEGIYGYVLSWQFK